MASTIAIIGAGWLGAPIANACPPPVLATTRGGTRPDVLAPHVTHVTFDLRATAQRPSALDDADTWLFSVAPGRDQDRRALYVDGPAAMLATLAQTRVRRVVWIGSTSALPDIDGVVDETCEIWPEDPRGRIQREAEAAVIDACERAGIAWMILRAGGLYGPGRALGRLFGRGDPEATLADRVTNLVHRDDAVTAAVAALGSSRVGIVHVVDDDHCTRRAMIDAARAEAGMPAADWPTPPAAPRGKRVANARLSSWLGVSLRHPRHGPLASPPGRA